MQTEARHAELFVSTLQHKFVCIQGDSGHLMVAMEAKVAMSYCQRPQGKCAQSCWLINPQAMTDSCVQKIMKMMACRIKSLGGLNHLHRASAGKNGGKQKIAGARGKDCIIQVNVQTSPTA